MEIPTLVVVLGGAILRNVQGWLPTAIQDGIDSYDWRRLAVTTARVVLVAGALHWGMEIDEGIATAAAVLFDFAYGEIEKLVKAKKTKK